MDTTAEYMPTSTGHFKSQSHMPPPYAETARRTIGRRGLLAPENESPDRCIAASSYPPPASGGAAPPDHRAEERGDTQHEQDRGPEPPWPTGLRKRRRYSGDGCPLSAR